MSDSKNTSYWIKFFKDAGIPPGDAVHYAVNFVDNRILVDMLNDLTKEYLHDMNISNVGDIIRILKHAKTIYEQNNATERIKRATSTTSVKAGTNNRSTAASRMVDRCLGSNPKARPMREPPSPPPPSANISKDLAARLGPVENTASTSGNKRSSTESSKEGTAAKYSKLSPNTMTTTKSPSIFNRLGPQTEVKGSDSVFRRLGDNVPQSYSSFLKDSNDTSEDNALPYAGVLKLSAKELRERDQSEIKKKAEAVVIQVQLPPPVISAEKSKKSLKTKRLSTPAVEAESSNSHGIFAADSADFINAIKSTRSGNKELTNKSDVRSRLGPQHSEVSSSDDIVKPTTTTCSQKGVFGRLGKPVP